MTLLIPCHSPTWPHFNTFIPLRGSLPHLSFWNGSLNTTVQACLRRPTDTPKGVRPVHQSPIPSLGPVVEHVFVQSAQGSPFCFRLTILSRYCWTAVWKPQRRIQVSSWDPNKRKQPKNKTKKTINQTNKKPGNRPPTHIHHQHHHHQKPNQTPNKIKEQRKTTQNCERCVKVPTPSRIPSTAPSTALWPCCPRLPTSHSWLRRLLQPE